MWITDVWRTHQLWGLFILAFSISYHLYLRYGFYVAIAIFYTLISAIYMFQGPPTWGELQTRIDVSSANGFGIILSILFFLNFLDRNGLDNFYRAFEVVIVANSVIVIVNGYGIFNAYSTDNTIAALATCVMWFKNTPTKSLRSVVWYAVKIVLPMVAMIKTGGSTCFAVLGITLLFFSLATGILELLILMFLTAGLGIYINQNMSFVGGARWGDWLRYMGWWWENANVFLGTGTGTFEWLAPWIFMKTGQGPEGIMLMLHNEYLQVIFEQGLIGLLLYGIVGWIALKRAYTTPWVFAGMGGLSVAMMTYYPFRFIVSAVFATCLIREALECRQNRSETLL